jgi:hypothetical protein
MSPVAFGAGKPDLDELRSSCKLWHDFVTFARCELDCQDVDPVYPVLVELQRGLSREQALWHTILYVAFYNLGSAVEVFAHVNEPDTLPVELAKLPTGIERRGFRTAETMNRHLASIVELAERHGGLAQWLGQALQMPETLLHPEQMSYLKLRDEILREPWGNGRWAAYKTSEILQKVNRMPVRATDMGNDDSSGPVAGLQVLYGPYPGGPELGGVNKIAWLDGLGITTMDQLNEEGVNVDIDVVETLLCDFHALVDGRYYPGHDIDQMADQLWSANPQWTAEVWRARAKVFRPEHLAERSKPEPPFVDKQRRKAYALYGEIVPR